MGLKIKSFVEIELNVGIGPFEAIISKWTVQNNLLFSVVTVLSKYGKVKMVKYLQ